MILNIYLKYKKKVLSKYESEENIYMDKKPFKVIICMGNCASSINQIHIILLYDYCIRKQELSKYSQLNGLFLN